MSCRFLPPARRTPAASDDVSMPRPQGSFFRIRVFRPPEVIYIGKSDIYGNSKGGAPDAVQAAGEDGAAGFGAVPGNDDVRRGVGLGGVEGREPKDLRRVRGC